MGNIRLIAIRFLLLFIILSSCTDKHVNKYHSKNNLNDIYSKIFKWAEINKDGLLYVPSFPDAKTMQKKKICDFYNVKPIEYIYNNKLIGSTGLRIDSVNLLYILKQESIFFNKLVKDSIVPIDLDTIYHNVKIFNENISNISAWLNKNHIEKGKCMVLFTLPLMLFSNNKKYILAGIFHFYPYSVTEKYFYLLEPNKNNYKVIKRIIQI